MVLLFYTYEHLKFHAELSWAWKMFYNLGAGFTVPSTERSYRDGTLVLSVILKTIEAGIKLAIPRLVGVSHIREKYGRSQRKKGPWG